MKRESSQFSRRERRAERGWGMLPFVPIGFDGGPLSVSKMLVKSTGKLSLRRLGEVQKA